MNIIDVQDHLKDFSEQQLIKEMQMPTGTAPQFLVLSEIQRRKRVRDDFTKRQAAAEPTVAEEAVAAAGVPMNGIAGMSEAMAPQSAASDGIGTIMPQTMRQSAPPPAPMPDDMAMGMRSGGLMSYGDELSQRLSNDKIDPFLDEVEQMASDRFGFQGSEGPMDSSQDKLLRVQERPSVQRPAIPQPPRFSGGKGGGFGPIQAVPFAQSLMRKYSDGGIVSLAAGGGMRIEERRMKNGQIGLFRGNTFLGLKEENKSKGSLAEKIGFGKDRDVLGRLKDALGLQEGGVVKAQTGTYFPSTAELYGLYGQESGYGQNLFGSAGEIGPFQVLPTTAIMPGNQIKSLFPELEAAIARGDYKDAEAAYKENKAMVDEALMSGEKVEPFVLDYLNNAERVLGNRNLATLAYNQGISGTKDFSGDVLDTDYVSGVQSNMAGFDEAREKLSKDVINQDMGQKPDLLSGLMGAQAATPTASPVKPVRSEEEINAKREFILGGIKSAMGPMQIRGLGEQYYGKGDPIIDAALEERGYRPQGMAVSTTEAATATKDITTASGEVIKAGETVPENTVLSQSEAQANAIPADATGGSVAQEVVVDAGKVAETSPSASIVEQNIASATAKKADDGSETTTDEGNVVNETKDGSGATPERNITYTPPKSGASSSLEAEILKLQSDMQKSREQAKGLAIAQAGLALMSSDNPTLLGAAGEAGVSGLKAFRESQDRYQEGVIDLINARAKLAKDGKSKGLTASSAVSRLKTVEEELRGKVDESGLQLIAPATGARRQILLEEEQRLRDIMGYFDVDAVAASRIPKAQ